MAKVRSIPPSVSLSKRMQVYGSVVAGVLLGVFTVIRFHDALHSFWLFDDPYLLHMAAGNNLLDFFVKSSVWRLISVRCFTPMVMLSLRTDYGLFGFHVQYFYGHQLVMLWLSSVMLYLLLKRYVDWKFSLLGAMLFLGSAPAGAAAHMLMMRHYVEGLFFCLLALLCFIKSVRKKSSALSLLGAGCFLCAALSKEIYVPAALLVLFLPEAALRDRLRYFLPFLAFLLSYFAWRGVMLGGVSGLAVGVPLTTAGIAGMVGHMPRDIIASVAMFAGAGRLAPAVGICIGILYLLEVFSLIARGNYKALGFVAVLVLFVYSVPMLAADLHRPTADFPSYRLVFSVTAFLAGSSAVATGLLYDREIYAKRLPGVVRWIALAALLVLFTLTTASSHRWLDMQKRSLLEPLSIQGRFFIKNGDGTLMVNAFPKYAATGYFENLEHLKGDSMIHGSPLVTAGMFAFPDKAAAAALERRRVFTFDDASGRMKDITRDYQKDRSAFLARLKDRPLSVNFRADRGVISYTFGPAGGHYFGLFGYRSGLYPSFFELPRIFKAQSATEAKRFYFRVVRETPEGWFTCSPEWLVDLSKDVRINWQRK